MHSKKSAHRDRLFSALAIVLTLLS